MKLSSNTILITGGASGIGLELAKQLHNLGNSIIITGRDQAKLKKAKEQLPHISTIQSDVSNPIDIASLFEQIKKDFPETNILINNAGILRTINLRDSTGSFDDVTCEIETNLKGPIRMIFKFLPLLKSKPTAAIVNVSSGLAFVPLPVSPIYCATKAGLHSFTMSLRVQLNKTNVKVFELAPPLTRTEILGVFDADVMKGTSIMKVEDVVAVAIKGIQADQFEIRPGQSNQMKMMSRLAPSLILKQLSKPVDRILDGIRH